MVASPLRQRSSTTNPPAWQFGAWLLAALVLAQAPSILDPGYFSFDELQWWARADVAWSHLPWIAWSDLSMFQYRPLTFNLWLVLAHAFAASPQMMHFVFVMIGSVNALLLATCLRAAGASRRVAMVASLAFVLTPFVAYTHAWVGTLADLLVLACTLCGVYQLQAADNPARACAGAATLTLVALLCKESAMVLPIALLAAAYGHRRPGVVLTAAACSAAIVAGYLVLRFGVLAHVSPQDSAYAWAPANMPRRLVEYLLFPFMPPLLEVGITLGKSAARIGAAGLCVATLLAALAARGWRWPLAWLMLYAGLLAPVLVLGTSYGQYAYLASAGAVAIIALAWSRLPRVARGAVCLITLVAVAHGIAVMARMREIGAMQVNFHNTLLEHLRMTNGPLTVSSAPSDHWMLERFLHDIPSYRGVAIGGRVVPVSDAHSPGMLLMQPDGRLVTAAAPPSPHADHGPDPLPHSANQATTRP
jgi:hypothetical protein